MQDGAWIWYLDGMESPVMIKEVLQQKASRISEELIDDLVDGPNPPDMDDFMRIAECLNTCMEDAIAKVRLIDLGVRGVTIDSIAQKMGERMRECISH